VKSLPTKPCDRQAAHILEIDDLRRSKTQHFFLDIFLDGYFLWKERYEKVRIWRNTVVKSFTVMVMNLYTIHRASDHEIVADADSQTLESAAQKVARILSDLNVTMSAYVHNGKAVVAAGLCQGGEWYDLEPQEMRDRFRKFEADARAHRAAAGFAND